MKLDISEDARADLLDIREFGQQRWGRAQAIDYSTNILAALHDLAEGTTSAPLASDLSPGLRRRFFGRHVVFHRVEQGRLQILRVLHQSQDPGRHLRQR